MNDYNENLPDDNEENLRRLLHSQTNLLEINNANRTINFTNMIREFKQFIYTSKCFSTSGLILSFITITLSYVINRRDWEIESLENNDMLFLYIILYFLVTIATWNLYLLINLLIADTKHIKGSTDIFITTDILYFNPIMFTYLTYYYDNTFLYTSFDVLIWLVITTHYFINFCFTINLFKYADNEISKITDLTPNTNKNMLIRMRINYIILVICNILFTFCVRIAIKDTDFMFKFFILVKVNFVLFLGHIFISETD
jgi:hypothetical protein